MTFAERLADAAARLHDEVQAERTARDEPPTRAQWELVALLDEWFRYVPRHRVTTGQTGNAEGAATRGPGPDPLTPEERADVEVLRVTHDGGDYQQYLDRILGIRATVKWDGTCTMIDEQGRWWARREVKPGKKPPPHFVPLETDPNTGKTVGWEPIEQASHRKAFESISDPPRAPGTYELCGPKVNGNPEVFVEHVLVPHGEHTILDDLGPDYDSLCAYLESRDIEGIVWHHPDGRKAKIKAKDFGLKRKSPVR